MTIELKLLIDKKKQKVVFAECDSKFVDVLSSFLMLPLGKIVNLLKKQSGLGCIDKLYESIEFLDANKYFQTAACKNMLLEPESIFGVKFYGLAVNICDDLKPRKIYGCSEWECALKNFPHYSSVIGVKCACGRLMNKVLELTKPVIASGDVFFKEAGAQFLVSDDLHVFVVSSLSVAFPFLDNNDIKDSKAFQVRNIQVDKTQVLHLLKRALLSKTPLTDVFIGSPTTVVNMATSSIAETEIGSDEVPVKRRRSDLYKSARNTSVKVKIFESNKVQLMEAGNDFMDLVFSFLTFPLGQAISLMGESCSSVLGCIRHIYESIDDMKTDDNDILTAKHKAMLLHTKLPPFYGCESQIFKVNEIGPPNTNVKICKSCFEVGKGICVHEVPKALITELNPKMGKAGSTTGGGFTRTTAKFIITTDMIVKPISIVSTMQFLKNIDVSINTLRERVVTIDETKASSFLKACLTSSTGIIDSLRE